MISTPDSSVRSRIGRPPLSQPGRVDRGKRSAEREKHLPPRSRGFTSIPLPEVLDKLVARALEALGKGITWDRGSILNIVV